MQCMENATFGEAMSESRSTLSLKLNPRSYANTNANAILNPNKSLTRGPKRLVRHQLPLQARQWTELSRAHAVCTQSKTEGNSEVLLCSQSSHSAQWRARQADKVLTAFHRWAQAALATIWTMALTEDFRRSAYSPSNTPKAPLRQIWGLGATLCVNYLPCLYLCLHQRSLVTKMVVLPPMPAQSHVRALIQLYDYQ